MMGMKTCPFCRRPTLQASARCSHCGAQLLDLLLASDAVLVHTRPVGVKRVARPCFYSLIVASGLVGACSALWWKSSEHSVVIASPSAIGHGPTYQTTAAHLYDDYADYETAVRTSPGPIDVQISGVIAGVSKDLFGAMELDLDVGDAAGAMSLTLDRLPPRALSVLVKGNSVRLICHDMSRIQRKPVGQNCRLAE